MKMIVRGWLTNNVRGYMTKLVKEDCRENRYRQTKKMKTQDTNYSSDDADDTMCIECTEFDSKSIPGEEWVQCVSCKMWVHSGCVKGNVLFYECKNCTSDCEDSN